MTVSQVHAVRPTRQPSDRSPVRSMISQCGRFLVDDSRRMIVVVHLVVDEPCAPRTRRLRSGTFCGARAFFVEDFLLGASRSRNSPVRPRRCACFRGGELALAIGLRIRPLGAHLFSSPALVHHRRMAESVASPYLVAVTVSRFFEQRVSVVGVAPRAAADVVMTSECGHDPRLWRESFRLWSGRLAGELCPDWTRLDHAPECMTNTLRRLIDRAQSALQRWITATPIQRCARSVVGRQSRPFPPSCLNLREVTERHAPHWLICACGGGESFGRPRTQCTGRRRKRLA